MKKLLLIFGFGILFSGIGLRAYFELIPTPEPTLDSYLENIFPDSLPGWQIQDQDMASSPESSARIADRLAYDDALFRIYQRGDTFIGLYVAYWTPGKVSYRWAGAHTPDTCWVLNGWTCLERENKVPFQSRDYEFQPAEFGVFEKDGEAQNVYFWHLIGGRAFTYKQEGVPNILGALIDIKEYGLDLRQEQFFIRLSSNKSIEALKQEVGFNEILDALADLKRVAATATEDAPL